MMTSGYLALLIPLCALVVAGVIITLVIRGQRAGMAAEERAQPACAAHDGTRAREQFVRRHEHRPGVVANGTTLIDLYDRIGALEARIAELESGGGRTVPS